MAEAKTTSKTADVSGTNAAPTQPIVHLSPDELAELQNPAIATNREGLKRVLQIGLLGLGIGGGTAAALGMRNYLGQSTYKPSTVGPRPSVIEVGPHGQPDPLEIEEDERKRRRIKTAEKPAPRAGLLFHKLEPMDVPDAMPSHWWKTPKPKAVVPPVPAISGYTQPAGQTFWDWLLGRHHVNIASKPWFMPAAIGAGMLGAYGGYKAVDSVADAMHKREREGELDEAKNEYRNALVEQYNTNKKASDDTFDRLARRMTTSAGWFQKTASIKDMAGTGTGAYLTLAGLLAAGSGMATYGFVKSRVPENRLAKAIKQRERLRWAARPPEIYAVSRPVLSSQSTALEDEDNAAKDRERMESLRPVTKMSTAFRG